MDKTRHKKNDVNKRQSQNSGRAYSRRLYKGMRTIIPGLSFLPFLP